VRWLGLDGEGGRREKLTMSAAPSLLSAALALATVPFLPRPNPATDRARAVAGRWQVRVAGILAELGTKRLDQLLELGDLAITLGKLGLEPLDLGDNLRVLLGAHERHIQL
jgi:hypothetical protein